MTTVDAGRKSPGWTADASTFGARLALIRQRMGWGNVKEAATACGLPVESWRSWERDNREPRRFVEIATIIAGRTDCDRDWLLRGPAIGQVGSEATSPKRAAGPLAGVSRPPGRPDHPERLVRTSPARPPIIRAAA